MTIISNPKYHPTPELLTDYASGSLRSSHALTIATHLEFCEDCRNTLRQLDLLGSVLFSTPTSPEKSVESISKLKTKLLDNLDDQATSQGIPQRIAGSCEEQNTEGNEELLSLPKALQNVIKSSRNGLHWSRVSLSMRIHKLYKDMDGSVISLTRVKPGGKMAHHAHTGDEITVVLKGSFSDETGVYRKGDFILRHRENRHRPVATRDTECVCLIVLDSPIRFTGLLTRWLNPFMGPVNSI